MRGRHSGARRIDDGATLTGVGQRLLGGVFTASPRARPAAFNGTITGLTVAAPLFMGTVDRLHEGTLMCLGAYLGAFCGWSGTAATRVRGLVIAAFANAGAFLAAELAHGALLPSELLLAPLVLMGAAFRRHRLGGRLGTMPATAFLIAAESAASRNALGHGLLVLFGGLWFAVVCGLVTRPRPAPRPCPPRWRHASVTAALACTLFAAVSWGAMAHGAWAVVTVLGVSRPGLARTVRRAGQRVAGTLIGGALAGTFVVLAHDPLVIALLFAAVAVLGFALRPLNYAWWVVFGTTLALLISDVSHPGRLSTVLGRMAMTGCGAALSVAAALLASPVRQDTLPNADRGVVAAHTRAAGN